MVSERARKEQKERKKETREGEEVEGIGAKRWDWDQAIERRFESGGWENRNLSERCLRVNAGTRRTS